MASTALKIVPQNSDSIELPTARVKDLEENGVVRSTVFPNRLRDVRSDQGFASLIDFHKLVPDITYSRLAKIERGQIFPRADELVTISEKLNCRAEDLLIDVTDPSFDRAAWAHGHVEASLAYRGGTMEDMRLGAALRIRRRQLGLSTTDMKPFGLPAATVSRIENADRPFSRWSPDIAEGVRRVFGISSVAGISRKVKSYEKDGELDAMMAELFSVGSLQSRQATAFSALASNLPGERGREIARSVEIAALESSDDAVIAPAADIVSKQARIQVFEGVTLSDGSMALRETDEQVRRRGGTEGLAVRADRAVLGPIDPKSVMVFDRIERSEAHEGQVVAIVRRRTILIGAIQKMGRGFRLVHSDGEESTCLSTLEGDVYRMVQVISPE